jgi:hypothetical protein
MKTTKIFFIAFISFAFYFCEKVIDIDLSGVEPKIVINGIITDQQGPHTVKISKSTDYFETSTFLPVQGSIVTISDDAGNLEILSEIKNGIYQTSEIQGVSGRTYTLKVIAEGEEYIASSTMQQAVEIDSISYEYISVSFGPVEEGYKLTCHYTPLDYDNTYCRFNVYCNDELSDLWYISSPVFDFGIEESFILNDSIKIELLVIDKAIHTYYLMLNEILDDAPFTGTPANPVSNLSNGALGYFSACTVRCDSIVIQ